MSDTPTILPHGLMFHHFHGPSFAPSQGSISADTLARILDHYADSHCLLDADDYLQRARSGELGERDVCVTFDDSLLCQYALALPVLETYRLRAFWFVYSSVITGNIEVLEIYRRFRTEYFADVDDFYQAFFDALDGSPHADAANTRLRDFSPDRYLAEFPFYTDNDRKFRFVRDRVLGQTAYECVMDAMMEAAGTSPAALAEGLWMGAGQLRALHRQGHVIGLHSHTHPTALAHMSADRQHDEYAQNQLILTEILGAAPRTMSHPCNSYSDDTLAVLGGLGIELGFRSNMSGGFASPLEHPREDHANIVRRLGL